MGADTSPWPKKRLEEVGTLLAGKGGTKADATDAGVPVVRYGELYTRHHEIIREFGSFVSLEAAPNYLPLMPGDVLFAGSGETHAEIGKSAAYLGELSAVAGGDLIVLRPNREADSRYLGYATNSRDAVLQKMKMGQGSSVIHIHASRLKNLVVPLPPLLEQRKIAEILGSVDEAIRATEAVIEQTRKVKEGLLQELLTKGIGHTKFKQTEIGEIPVGWEVKTLGQVASFKNGKAHEQQISDEGSFLLINSKFVSSDGLKAKRTTTCLCPVQRGDTVLVMSDVPNGKTIAKGFIIEDASKYSLNQRICALSPISVEPKFLFHVVNRNRYFLSFDDGVGQTNLRKQEVLDCPFPVPSRGEQIAIVERLDSVQSSLVNSKKHCEVLQRTKQGLLQDLLIGKVRVKV